MNNIATQRTCYESASTDEMRAMRMVSFAMSIMLCRVLSCMQHSASAAQSIKDAVLHDNCQDLLIWYLSEEPI